MKIKYLEIDSCNRFPDKTKFRYSPTKPIQLIIGSNGSGKSTLLSYLYPQTPNRKDFYNDGYRKLKYILDAGVLLITNQGSHNSFNLNGNELNKGGTLKVQKELIEEYFSVDDDILDIQRGDFSFSNCRLAERRYWILKLCPVDFSYALNVFKGLNTRLRDVKGILKHLSSKLLDLQIDETYISQRVKTLEVNKAMLKELSDTKKKEYNTSTTMEHIKSLKRHIDKLSSIEKPTRELSQIMMEIGSVDESINKLQENIVEIKEYQEKERTDKYIKSLSNEIDTLQKTLDNMPPPKENVEKLDEGVLKLNLDDSITFIIENQFDLSTSIDKHKNLYEVYMSKKDRYLHQMYKLQGELGIEETSCPKCHTKFIPNTDSTKDELVKELQEVECLYKKYVDKANSLGKLIDKINEVNLHIEHIHKSIIKYTQITKVEIQTHPHRINRLLSDLGQAWITNRDKLNIEDKLETYKKELINAKSLMKRYVQNGVKSSIEEEEAKITKLAGLYNRLITEKNKTEVALKNLEKLNNLKLELSIKESDIPLLEKNAQIIQHNKLIDDNIAKIEKDIYLIDNEISEYKVRVKIYEEAKEEQKKYKAIHTVVTELIESIHPSDGLVGHQIKTLIQKLLDDVNYFISLIWGDEMHLAIGDNVYVPNVVRRGARPNTIDKCSAGMSSVIDMAFRLVAIKYLDKTDRPFIIDEFGNDFDHFHKKKSMELINKLPEYGYTNIYVVSHYTDSIYTLSNQAEITVMDDTNLSLDVSIKSNTMEKL